MRGASDDQFRTKEWEKMRKSLDHSCIVKFHHRYNEKGRVWSFVIEPLSIADGTLATVAQQRMDNLREFNIWGLLFKLSSALAYLHSQPSGPFLALDLSPNTVMRVYMAEKEKMAKLVDWKLLLLGSNTEHSLLKPV